MQSCDCCCRYNHRQIPRHVECDGKRMLTSPPPLRCQSDSNNNNGHNENLNRSNSCDKITHDSSPESKFEDRPKPFSIDAILSRPVKSEVSRDPKQELHVSHKMRTQRESVSPPCLYRSCHSPSSIARSCCSPSRLSPEPLSPPHPDHLPIYRHSRFVAPMRNFHFEKHSYNEPTMVHMEKQHFTTGCAGCPDCKMSEMRRFRLGPTSVLSNGNDMLAHQESMLNSGQDTKRNKRKRTIFTAEQLDRLEHEFQHQQYVVGQERKYLAVELGLNEIQVKVWFQNRRIKWRKQKGSRIQQMPVQIEEF